MSIYFERVAIIGVGLLGASLGLALKKRSLAKSVVGIGRRSTSLDIALEGGALDQATLDVEKGTAEADLIVIATPAGLVASMLEKVLAVASHEAVITDVASTKAAICAHAARCCPRPRRFVGSHPMAGGEKFGPDHGTADLYENTVCLVETDPHLADQARDAVCRLWAAVGARVVPIAPGAHDAMLARTSHAPHIVASALARIAGAHGATADFIGNGFRDATRIAASRPEIWRDICLENSSALGEALEQINDELAKVGTLLREGDAMGLEHFFAEGVQAHGKVTQS